MFANCNEMSKPIFGVCGVCMCVCVCGGGGVGGVGGGGGGGREREREMGIYIDVSSNESAQRLHKVYCNNQLHKASSITKLLTVQSLSLARLFVDRSYIYRYKVYLRIYNVNRMTNISKSE